MNSESEIAVAGCFLMLLNIIISAAALAGGVWLVVVVLQAMGVL